MAKGFRVYVDPDEEAFQRSLLGQAVPKAKSSSSSSVPVMDRQTARAKVGQFLLDSAKYMGLELGRAYFVPFKAEFPTYQDMTDEQRDYYLNWRREFIDGHPLNADEGYILCFAYEIINQTLMISPKFGAELLVSLLTEYGDRFPAVARQLVRWIEDYYAAYLTVDQLYQDLMQVDTWVLNLFECGRFLPAIFEDQPLDYDDICALTAISHKRCLFANNWDQMSEFKEILPSSFGAVDAIIRGRSGKSWLSTIATYSRRAFPGAVYGGDEEVKTSVIDFSPGPQRDVFARIARLTELLMGEEVGYGNKKMTSNIQRLEAQIDDPELVEAIRAQIRQYYS